MVFQSPSNPSRLGVGVGYLLQTHNDRRGIVLGGARPVPATAQAKHQEGILGLFQSDETIIWKLRHFGTHVCAWRLALFVKAEFQASTLRDRNCRTSKIARAVSRAALTRPCLDWNLKGSNFGINVADDDWWWWTKKSEDLGFDHLIGWTSAVSSHWNERNWSLG